MKTAITDLLGSKKFITTILAVIVAIGARYGLELDQDIVLAVLGLFAVLVGAQGATDIGKGKAELLSAEMARERREFEAFEGKTPPARPAFAASGEVSR